MSQIDELLMEKTPIKINFRYDRFQFHNYTVNIIPTGRVHVGNWDRQNRVYSRPKKVPTNSIFNEIIPFPCYISKIWRVKTMEEEIITTLDVMYIFKDLCPIMGGARTNFIRSLWRDQGFQIRLLSVKDPIKDIDILTEEDLLKYTESAMVYNMTYKGKRLEEIHS